jgi:hypothetical protein
MVDQNKDFFLTLRVRDQATPGLKKLAEAAKRAGRAAGPAFRETSDSIKETARSAEAAGKVLPAAGARATREFKRLETQLDRSNKELRELVLLGEGARDAAKKLKIGAELAKLSGGLISVGTVLQSLRRGVQTFLEFDRACPKRSRTCLLPWARTRPWWRGASIRCCPLVYPTRAKRRGCWSSRRSWLLPVYRTPPQPLTP